MAAPRLLNELRRRHVFRVAIAYAVTAWLLLQLAAIVLPTFGAPHWVLKVLIGVFVLFFPVAILLAWAFEVTPEGVRRTEPEAAEAARPPGHRRHVGRALNIGIIVVLAAAVGLLAWQRFGTGGGRGTPGITGAGTAATPAATVPAKSIAVLPFENLSADKNNAYFANGMQDMILTKLAGIGDLKVISRTSTEKYASRPDNLKAVARQLGVATILEGSVQKAGDQVLINVQLIDAASDNHLWAQAYSRKLDNIFGVEGEVAQKVADALKAKLTPAESAHVAAAPTHDAAAFDMFLKAEELALKAYKLQSEVSFLAADADYLKAIALDPNFALAYARLAFNQLQRHWFATPLTAAQLATTKAYAERALALAPNLPEAHLALGYYYYYGFRQYAAATSEFKRALALAPNNVDAIAGLAYVARRSGQVADALVYLKQAVAISPRDPVLLTSYGETLMLMRRYAQADVQLRRSLILSPGDVNSYDVMLSIQLFGFGDADATRNAVKALPGWRFAYANVTAGDIMILVNTRTYANVFARHFDAALHAWDSAPAKTQEQRRTGRVARIAIKLLAGRAGQARPECAQLAPSLRAALAQDPKSLSLLQQLSWVDVCLGRNTQAIALAQRAVAALPISKDSYNATFQLIGLAQIAAWAEDHDLALKIIRQLLAMPAGDVMSIERLKLDPVFDPLRKDPRFQALLKQYPATPAAATAL